MAQQPTTLPVRQTKFSNGEISPMLYGDVSHPKFMSSLRTCKNWIPTPQGALVNRPGTVYKATAKDPNYSPRLVPFVFSDAQAFVLEFGDSYIRFYKNGQYVGAGGLNSGAYREIATTYTKAMLPYLDFKQVGNTITITYGGQNEGTQIPPMDLAHTTGAIWPWVLSVTPLKIPAGAFAFAAAPTDGVFEWAAGSTYARGDRAYLTNATGVVEWVSIQDNNKGNSPPNPPTLNSTGATLNGSLYWMPSVDVDHPALAWSWVYTAVVQDANGVTYESLPSNPLTLNTVLGIDRHHPISSPAGSVPGAGYTALYWRIYRASAGGLYGWIGNAPNAKFVDEGGAADYAQQPPAGTDPFLNNAVDSYPAVVGYLGQRRVFAGSLAVPQGIWASRDGDFYNYDRPNPGLDTDALLITIAGEKLEQVRAIVNSKRGLVFTGQGEWVFGDTISKSSRDLRQMSNWGSSWIKPVKIGNGVLFNTAKSNMVRDFYPLYGLYTDNWDGQELSFMVRHMFDLYTITDWAFQSVPYPVLWMVRSDGKLLSLTYQHAPPSFGQQITEGVSGWAIHETGGAQSDAFEAVCVVPEPPEDAVYVVVKRTVQGVTKRYIERMNNPVCPASLYAAGVSDPRYGVYLDSAVVTDGHGTGGQISLDSYPGGGGRDAAVNFAVGNVIDVFFNSGETAFLAADEGTAKFILDPEKQNGHYLSGKIVHYIAGNHALVELDTALTQDQVNLFVAASSLNQVYGVARSVFSMTNLTGYAQDTLDANGARGVAVLADGNPAAIADWSGGVLTLQSPALVVCAGVSYNCDVALLDAHHGNADIRNLKKKLLKIGFEVGGGRGLWGGIDFTKLWEWEQRNVSDAYGNVPLATGYYEIEVTDSWDKGGRAVMRQIDPLPMTLTSVLREYALGQT